MKLNAENMKNEMWEIMKELRKGEIDPTTANSYATQARGILSTIRTEISIQKWGQDLSSNIKGFTK